MVERGAAARRPDEVAWVLELVAVRGTTRCGLDLIWYFVCWVGGIQHEYDGV